MKFLKSLFLITIILLSGVHAFAEFDPTTDSYHQEGKIAAVQASQLETKIIAVEEQLRFKIEDLEYLQMDQIEGKLTATMISNAQRILRESKETLGNIDSTSNEIQDAITKLEETSLIIEEF